MRVMHDAHLDFGNNAILAWDLSRANHLLADYYLAGWIDEQHYIKEVFDVTSKIQKNFLHGTSLIKAIYMVIFGGVGKINNMILKIRLLS